ncbi:GNAT family N-acetyltransferase [Gammaproteobacteria bacterium]|nr:GNAT family N-acetyltransferase [Gammaproteobacteria bacterium]
MIFLRDFLDSDIRSIARHANNYNVSRYMASRMPYPYTEGDAQWWVATGSREQGLNMAIDLDSECIGVVGVQFGQGELQYSAEIGYWIAEEHWGKGIATDAVAIMTERVFADYKIVRLSAPVFSPNKASMRVLEKCGYSLEAVLHKSVFKNHEFMDEHLFVKFRS